MKKWNTPAVEELNIEATANVPCSFDSVDGNIYDGEKNVIGYTRGTTDGSGTVGTMPDARK